MRDPGRKTDEAIDRIVRGYAAATPVSPTGEWQWIRDRYAVDLRAALEAGDRNRLSEILATIFVVDASFGLLSPWHDEDVAEWRRRTGRDVSELELPAVGGAGPIYPDSPRHDHLAERASALVSDAGTIVEIGGGYGGFYTYLHRRRNLSYVNIDLPETLAIFDFFVTQATDAEIAWHPGRAEVQLVSAGDRDRVKLPGRVDCVCNFRSWSEMSADDVAAYFALIDRVAPRYVFHENAATRLWDTSSRGHVEVLAAEFPLSSAYALVDVQPSPWKTGGGRHSEYLYERAVA